MEDKWIGCYVSVDCGEEIGVFQGQISGVNDTNQSVTLKKVFWDGLPHPDNEVTISVDNIEDLEMINVKEDTSDGVQASTVTVTKPVPKRAVRSLSECLPLSHKERENQLSESPRKQGGDWNNKDTARTPSKKDRNRQKWAERDEACFGAPVDNMPDQEFDFEKNLALFNKQAVYEEINAAQRPDVIRHIDFNRRTQHKYRHDENVIVGLPPVCKRVLVPSPDVTEYVTDDGFIIPSITPDLRYELSTAADRFGLGEERQMDLLGRSVTEMTLHLIGGSHRLDPRNVQGRPLVVVLCSSERHGVVGVNCARQLACQGIETVVYMEEPDSTEELMAVELNLYRLTNNRLVTSVQELPRTGVDLIISSLSSWCDEIPVSTYDEPVNWANENRAPVLAIDPPVTGTPGLNTKFSILPVMPLAHSPENGKLYLCNLTYPEGVFLDCGIEYVCPFGSKFTIPLHPRGS